MRTIKLLTAILACILFSNGYAQVNSVQSGNWADGSTWSGSTSFQDVTISSGDTVTVPASTTHFGHITVANGGVINITSFGLATLSKNITVSAGGEVIGVGNLTATSGSLNVYGSISTTGIVKSTGAGMDLVVHSGGSITDAEEVAAEGRKMEVIGSITNVVEVRTFTADMVVTGTISADTAFISGTDADLLMLSGSPSVTINTTMRINDGRFEHAAGTLSIGNDFSVTRTDADTASVSSTGGFTVGGNLLIKDEAQVNNSAAATITGGVQIENGASLSNSGTLNVGDSVHVHTGANLTNSGTLDISDNLYNSGTVANSDAIDCEDLYNHGIITNSGDVDISDDLINHSIMEGAGGNFTIADHSANWDNGEFDGSIDICDATLAQSTWYVDLDSGTVDFLTVTFCGETIIEGTGIEELNSQSVTFYPNPTNGLVNISIGNSTADLQVMDLLGNVVATKQVVGSANVNLTDYRNGIYLLRLTSGESVITRKVIKQ